MSNLAISTSAFADEISPHLPEQLAQLKRLRFTGFDLRNVFGKNVVDLSEAEIAKVRQAVESAGLVVQAIGSPVNKVPVNGGTAGEELSKLQHAVAAAEGCGTKNVRIFSPESDDWSEVKAWMEPQIKLAEKSDIVLLHENDSRYFGAFPDRAKRLFDHFGGANFRAAFDFANTVLIGYSPLRDWFPWLLPHLHTLHIKDAVGSQQRVVPAGEGDGEMVATLKFLKRSGWSGTLTLEPHLSSAGRLGGFSGVELFEQASNAMWNVLAQAETEE